MEEVMGDVWDVQGQDVHPLDMEPWRNWDLSESTRMEKRFSGMRMHGTTVSKILISMSDLPQHPSLISVTINNWVHGL